MPPLKIFVKNVRICFANLSKNIVHFRQRFGIGFVMPAADIGGQYFTLVKFHYSRAFYCRVFPSDQRGMRTACLVSVRIVSFADYYFVVFGKNVDHCTSHLFSFKYNLIIFNSVPQRYCCRVMKIAFFRIVNIRILFVFFEHSGYNMIGRSVRLRACKIDAARKFLCLRCPLTFSSFSVHF